MMLSVPYLLRNSHLRKLKLLRAKHGMSIFLIEFYLCPLSVMMVV